MKRSWAGLFGLLFGAFLLVAGCSGEKRNFGRSQGGNAGMNAMSGGAAGVTNRSGAGGTTFVSSPGGSAGSEADAGSGASDLKANGLACASNGDCESAVCRDKVCCDKRCDGTCQACAAAYTGVPDGTCAPTLAGSDPHESCAATTPESCGTDGSCDGAGSCRKFGTNQICAHAACSGSSFTPDRSCDGEGTCQTAAATACGAFPCSEVGCQKPCTLDADCPTGSYCDEAKKCHNKNTDGQPCATGQNNQCRSNACVDDVCCENDCKGTCSACSKAKTGQDSGRCVGIPAGQDPDNECAVDTANACGKEGTCNGGGACRVRAVGTSCGTASCSGNTLTPAGSCNGGSTCSAGATAVCSGNLTCASASACLTSCSADANCVSGYYCAGTSCAPKKAKGASCTAANQCTAGFCKDNFCCDGACSLTCQACSNALTGLANGSCGQKTSDATKACPLNAPTSCAVVQTDLNNCGTCGTACASVPNQTRACKSGTCDYKCLDPKYTLTCSPSSPKTACSQWDFEVANNPDDWFVVQGSNGSNGGVISSSNKFASSGSRSLAIPYTNVGGNPATGDYRWVNVAVKLCANGGKVDLSGKYVTWKFRMDPPAPSGNGYNYFVMWPVGNPTATGGIGNMDFNANATNLWWSSTEYYANQPQYDGASAAAIGFHLQVNETWTGTMYLDDIQIY